MKQIVFVLLSVLVLSLQNCYAQEIPEGAIKIDENTLIKDESGQKVEMSKLMGLMNSGQWSMEPVHDSEGKLLYMKLRKATEEEKKMMAQMSIPQQSSDLIGKSVPNFKMMDINGNTISTENTKSKVVVLNFWFTACKPCISEIPELNDIYKKYKADTNVVFASITFDKQDKVKSFLKKHPIKYPVISDATDICELFMITGYPTNIVIDKNGNYHDLTTGGYPQIGQHISNSIQSALDGKKNTSNSLSKNEIKIDPTSTFKLENGEVIQFEKAIALLNSNKYDILPSKENGKDYYLIKEKK